MRPNRFRLTKYEGKIHMLIVFSYQTDYTYTTFVMPKNRLIEDVLLSTHSIVYVWLRNDIFSHNAFLSKDLRITKVWKE